MAKSKLSLRFVRKRNSFFVHLKVRYKIIHCLKAEIGKSYLNEIIARFANS
jgi:hypothetical protein